ncbi:MAG: rimM [Frankiales bacterium]|nr:rimM [Frankiales bacterium]
MVAVGRVGKAHGIRGEAFVEPWTDAISERFVPGARLATDPPDRGPLEVAEVRDHSGKLIIRFAGIESRSAVESIRGTVLVVPAADRPPLDDPDEFYDTDLVGLRVRTLDGVELGPVAEVLHSPSGSLLAITRLAEPERELLIPFLKAFVPTVDLAVGEILVDPPEGLLEL